MENTLDCGTIRGQSAPASCLFVPLTLHDRLMQFPESLSRGDPNSSFENSSLSFISFTTFPSLPRPPMPGILGVQERLLGVPVGSISRECGAHKMKRTTPY